MQTSLPPLLLLGLVSACTLSETDTDQAVSLLAPDIEIAENRFAQIDDLVELADLVFVGEVLEKTYQGSTARSGYEADLPHTFVTYRVQEVLKGNVSDASITLRFEGGMDRSNMMYQNPDYPLFDRGEIDLLFIKRNTRKSCPLVGCATGRVRFLSDRAVTEDGNEIFRDSRGTLYRGSYFISAEVELHEILPGVGITSERNSATDRRSDQLAQAGYRRTDGPDITRVTRDIITARYTPEELARMPVTPSADPRVPFYIRHNYATPPPEALRPVDNPRPTVPVLHPRGTPGSRFLTR